MFNFQLLLQCERVCESGNGSVRALHIGKVQILCSVRLGSPFSGVVYQFNGADDGVCVCVPCIM